MLKSCFKRIVSIIIIASLIVAVIPFNILSAIEADSLSGKSIIFFGDSIGAGWRDNASVNDYSNSGGWHKRIVDNYGATATLAAIAGAPLSTIREAEGRPSIVEQLHTNKNGKYDYVVLQDNGNATYDDSKPALDVLVPLIEQTGAEVLLYKRYSSNSDPSQRPASADRHEQTYTKLASTFGIEKVAPVADAFLICTEKYPSINLYHTDNSHHNATAAYLVACVFAITYLDMDITNNTYTAGLDATTVKALKECAKIACEQGYNYNK